MDISYLSIIVFLIITIVYYMFPAIGKLPITLDMIENNNLSSYYNANLPRLGLYFLAIVVSQFALNTLYLVNKCGGNASANIGMAAFYTIIPWVLMFGVMIAVLMMYPGLKTAFSDVVGYFAVAGKANDILASLLVDTKIENMINTSSGMSEDAKNSMKKSAEAILKLCGNKSILINQMSPENFVSVWDMLTPLMKNNGDIPGINEQKNELFQLVILKDNIGEGMWYFYTAILLISIVYYNLASKGCVKTLDQLKASHDEFLKQEEETLAKQELNNSTPLTL